MRLLSTLKDRDFKSAYDPCDLHGVALSPKIDEEKLFTANSASCSHVYTLLSPMMLSILQELMMQGIMNTYLQTNLWQEHEWSINSNMSLLPS